MNMLLPTPLNSDAGPRGGTTGFGLRDWSRAHAKGEHGNDPVLLPTPMARDFKTGYRDGEHAPTREGSAPLNDIVHLLPTPRATRGGSGTETMYAAGGERTDEDRPQGTLTLRGEAQWGEYATAIARWEEILGRPAPAAATTSSKGNAQLAPAFVEWMMGADAGWVTAVPHLTRNEALRALGNGVVPQQAAAAVADMLLAAVAA